MAEKLRDYERKRDFQATPEPSPRSPLPDPQSPRFVIQEHSATRLHWDLRLEHDGALRSWAVPNGIPMDPKENRKAVRTEDHPLEYLEFHGEIPKGNYGAGTMTIWDRGTFEPEKFRESEGIATFAGEGALCGPERFREGEGTAPCGGGRGKGKSPVFQPNGHTWITPRRPPPQD